MRNMQSEILSVWRSVLAAVVCIAVGLSPSPAQGAEDIDPEADRILRTMSSYLAGIKKFSVKADTDWEVVAHNGQKLQISNFATIVMERPAKLHATEKGMFTDAEVIFDGNKLTLHGKKRNAYAQINVSGTIDDAILAYESEVGLSAPGADLLFADPYTILAKGIESSAFVGTAYVNGIECHHLAFREAKIDWQLWVRTGDVPLPVKYVITSKWKTSAPQYEIELRDWNTNPEIKDDQFTFTVPEGALEVVIFALDYMGEFARAEQGLAMKARNSSRRTIRRTSRYETTLPERCSAVVIEGTTLYQCDGTYYQPLGDRYVVVNVD